MFCETESLHLLSKITQSPKRILKIHPLSQFQGAETKGPQASSSFLLCPIPLTSNVTFMSQGNCKGQNADYLPNAGALSILSLQGPTPPRGSLSSRQPAQAALTPPGRRTERRRTFLSKIPPAREGGRFSELSRQTPREWSSKQGSQELGGRKPRPWGGRYCRA